MAKTRLGQLSRQELLELLIAQQEQATALPTDDGARLQDLPPTLGAHAKILTPHPPRFATINSNAVKSQNDNHQQRPSVPPLEELYEELAQEQSKNRMVQAVRSTLAILVTVAAVAVLVATLVTPVLQITGTSMTPTLHDGQLVVSLRGSNFSQGDVIAFYYNNKILVKRVIAGPGDWVDIDRYGNVSVNDQPLDEPYLTDKALGECDIDLPYQVPDGRWFVMGDHRATSVDSRSSAIGCVAEEQVVGNIAFRIWPILDFGPVQ